MGRTQFKRLLRGPEKKEARTAAPSSKPWETKDIASSGENLIAPDAAEPSPDADRPKSACPDVGAAAVDGTDSGQSGSSSGTEAESRPSDEEQGRSAPPSERRAPAVFTDKSVCRRLRVRRRILADARKASTRGVDWDAVGEEVGMTQEWIDRYAIEHHIVPNFAAPLERVAGKYVSARVVSTTANRCICIAELVATSARAFVRVRDMMIHPMHYQEVFDCLRIDAAGGSCLEWVAEPNDTVY